MPYRVPELPFAYDALEPIIDAETVRIHHDKHHAKYAAGFERTQKQMSEAREKKDYGLMRHLCRQLSFHGSGHLLHMVYWQNLTPHKGDDGKKPQGRLADAIKMRFGNVERLKKELSEAAKTVEGNGWGILAYNTLLDELNVLQSENHGNTTIWGSSPLVAIDVWEHAYYLKYKNERARYVDSLMEIINWQDVSIRFESLLLK